MSTPRMIPFIAPDGTVSDVPLEKIADAIRMGGKPAVDMVHAGTGARGVVPQNRYQDALAAGAVPYRASSVPQPAGLTDPQQPSIAQRAL